MADLDGRVAVVTGAARGIGLGIAERLSAAGAAVVVADIDGATAEKSAKTLNGRAIAVEHDVRDGESSKRLRQNATPTCAVSYCARGVVTKIFVLSSPMSALGRASLQAFPVRILRTSRLIQSD